MYILDILKWEMRSGFWKWDYLTIRKKSRNQLFKNSVSHFSHPTSRFYFITSYFKPSMFCHFTASIFISPKLSRGPCILNTSAALPCIWINSIKFLFLPPEEPYTIHKSPVFPFPFARVLRTKYEFPLIVTLKIGLFKTESDNSPFLMVVFKFP